MSTSSFFSGGESPQTNIYEDEAKASALAAAQSATQSATSAEEAAAHAAAALAVSDSLSDEVEAAQNSETAAGASATSAATSAASASNSATTASAKAAEAALSADNASSSASTASTNATAASGSATAAATAQTAAESARDATLAAFDSFDDRYLGVKTSNPTLDNDGNALVAGALYFNSTSGEMRVYTGSAWTAAYVSGESVLLQTNNLSDLASASTARTNLGLGNVENKSSATIRGEISSSNVTTALGFTPYNATNPSGYITGITSGNVTTALGFTPTNKAGDNFTGNLGVGVPTPGTPIDVVANTFAIGLRIRGRSSDNLGLINFGSNTTAADYAYIGTPVANALAFYTNGYTERLRIDATGNVGIGVSSPAVKLDVAGGVNNTGAFRSIAGGVDAIFGANNFATGVVGFGSVSNHPITFNTNLAERARITIDGNVGIGTTSPATRLHIGRTGEGTSVTFGSVTYAMGRLGEEETTNTVFVANGYTTSRLSFRTNGIATSDEKMCVNTNGNVGVGTSSPASRLDVNGTVNFTGALTSGDLADAVGYKGLPQNSRTAAYTLALSDMGKHISITTGGVVIPANGSVAFPIGATIVVFNNSGSNQTISITTDTLRLAGAATTGSRTLAQYGLATCVKVAATTWAISGAGLT